MKSSPPVHHPPQTEEKPPCWCEEPQAFTGEEVDLKTAQSLKHTLEFTLRVRVDKEAVSLLFLLNREKGEAFVKMLLRSVREEAREEVRDLLLRHLTKALREKGTGAPP